MFSHISNPTDCNPKENLSKGAKDEHTSEITHETSATNRQPAQ